jgi:hypothetical protein
MPLHEPPRFEVHRTRCVQRTGRAYSPNGFSASTLLAELLAR